MSVDVLFLGTGDAFGTGGRLPSAALVSTPRARVLVDCGPATLPALRARGVDVRSIDAIVLTHLHGDHFGGVPFFLMDAHYAAARTTPLTIAGPPEVAARTARLQELLFPGHGRLPVRFGLAWHEWPDGGAIDVAGLSATAVRVAHATELPCYGIRLRTDDRVLAFSGDTEWTDALVGLAADADLFVCECFGYDAAPPRHMTYTALMAARSRLSCRRIVLTHMGEDMLRRSGDVELELAADGLQLTI